MARDGRLRYLAIVNASLVVATMLLSVAGCSAPRSPVVRVDDAGDATREKTTVCPATPSRASPTRDEMLDLVDETRIDGDARLHASESIRKAPEESLDVVERLVASSDG